MTLRPLLLAALASALAPAAALANARHPVVFIRQTYAERDDPALTPRFLSSLQAGIESEFPCASVWSSDQLRDIMNRERNCQLLGGGSETGDCGGLKTAGGIVGGTEYLLATESTTGPLGSIFSATLLNVHGYGAVARSAKQARSGAGAAAAIDALVKDLVHQLARYQLCPYRGRVKIAVSEKTTRHAEEGYGVYCNGDDQRYSRTERDERNVNTLWQLERLPDGGRRYAEGTVEHRELSERSFREEDPCHACPSGRRGPETRTRKSSSSTRIGLDGAGTSTTGAMIELGFEEDGTFRLVLLAASDAGQKTGRVEEHAEGTCTKPVNTDKRDPPTTVKVGIGGQGFGPFQGSPHDRTLSGTQRKVEKIPDGERVIELEFSLRRD